MKLDTHTDLWHLDPKLYAIKDLVLWFPIRYKAGAVFLVVAVVWVPLALGLDLPGLFAWTGKYSSGFSALVVWGPPMGAGIAVGRNVVDGRTLDQVAVSWIRWRLTGPKLVGMDLPVRERESVGVYAEAWTPTRKDK